MEKSEKYKARLMEKSEKYKARLMEKSEKYKARLLQDARASPVLWGARKRDLLYKNAIPYDNLLNLIKNIDLAGYQLNTLYINMLYHVIGEQERS